MKTRFLSILALLLVAATGVWAQTDVIDLTVVEAGKQWSFDMPDSDVELQVEYKAVTSTALTYNGETIPTEGLTVVTGTEQDFIGKLQASVLDENQEPANVENPTFTYKSSNTDVVAFGDNNAEEGTLDQIKFLKAGEAELTAQFDGNDDLARSEATVTLTVEEAPAYTVRLKSGTDDAENWNAKAGNAEAFSSLSPDGMEVRSGQQLTIKYDGTRKVKSIKAVKKAASSAKPMTSATTEDIGKVIGADGKIYANVAAAQAASTTACAIIAYVGTETAESQNHGLAIAMKDAAAGGSVKWSSSNNDESLTDYNDVSQAVTTAQSGLSNSQTSGFDNESNYPAFYAALHNTITTSDGISAAAPASGTSGWFLPSLYQWNKIVKGLSGQSADLSYDMNDNYKASSLNTKIEAVGGTGLQSNLYWSSTECYNGNGVWLFSTVYGFLGPDTKGSYYFVRSAFAF